MADDEVHKKHKPLPPPHESQQSVLPPKSIAKPSQHTFNIKPFTMWTTFTSGHTLHYATNKPNGYFQPNCHRVLKVDRVLKIMEIIQNMECWKMLSRSFMSIYLSFINVQIYVGCDFWFHIGNCTISQLYIIN